MSCSLAPQEDVPAGSPIDVETLASFTHHYAPAPSGYDDAKAAGGRTYFFQPLPFRRVANPQVPRLTTRSWMASNCRRRRPSIFVVCTAYKRPVYQLPSYMRGTLLGNGIERMQAMRNPVAVHIPPTPSPGRARSPATPEPFLTLSAWLSQASPVPPLGYDESCASDSESNSESEPAFDCADDGARRCRENPRVHRRWSKYPVTPAINRESLVFGDESCKPECNIEDLGTTVVVGCSEPNRSEKQTFDEVSSAVKAVVVEDVNVDVRGTDEKTKRDDNNPHESALFVELLKSPAAPIAPEQTSVDEPRQAPDESRVRTKQLVWFSRARTLIRFIMAAIFAGIKFALSTIWTILAALLRGIGWILTMVAYLTAAYLLLSLALTFEETIMYYILFSVIAPVIVPGVIHSQSNK